MVAITATNSASPSLQATLSRARYDQARRDADRAESEAQDLRTRADAAEVDAKKSQEKVNQLAASLQQDTTYSQPTRLGTAEVPPQVQSFVERLYKATSPKFAASGNPLKTDANAAPVVNAQGQSTGKILNVQA